MARRTLDGPPAGLLIRGTAAVALAAAALTGAVALTTAAGPAAAATGASSGHPIPAMKPAAPGVAVAAAAGHSSASPAHHARLAARTGHHSGHRAHVVPAAHIAHAAHASSSAEPYSIYDSVTPTSIPTGNVVATYATGGYAVSRAAIRHERRLLWIDTQGNDPAANVLDVEPGDATPSQAAVWAWHRLRDRPHALARIYTMRNEWAATKAAVAQLPEHMRSRVRWWIADPTGVPHLVPGSNATQWYWGHGYDVTTATPGF